MNVIKYETEHVKLNINPVGARIEFLQINGQTLLDKIIRGDGKSASTHPCTPIFGPERTTHYDLQQHGPMRNAVCRIDGQTKNLLTLSYRIAQGSYPIGMLVTQRFLVDGPSVVIETTHSNTGSQPAPVNFCEHFYWYAPSGWNGTKVNGVDISEQIKADTIIPLHAKNYVEIPKGPSFILEQEGLPVANVWAMQHADKTTYDQNYVCIEPCEADQKSDFFGSEQSMIAPGTFRRATIILSIND